MVTNFLLSQDSVPNLIGLSIFVLHAKTSRWMYRTRKTCYALGLILLSISVWDLSVSAQNPFTAQIAPSPRNLVYKVAPKYPRELKQNEIAGVVGLSFPTVPNGA